MYQRILVPLDGSQLARAILSHVEGLSLALKAEVILFRVLPASGAVAEVARKQESSARKGLQGEETRLQKMNISASFSIRHGDDAAEEIIDYAAKNEIDLIAMSTHGRTGLGKVVLGSVAEKVLAGTSKPILLIRAKGTESGATSS